MAKSTCGEPFKCPMTAIYYNIPGEMQVGKRVEKLGGFKYEKKEVWNDRFVRDEFKQYKLNQNQVENINFSKMKMKLKSVKPLKGKARSK